MMKKKLLGTLVFLIAAVGVMYLMGVFDSGQATEEDNTAAEEVKKELEDVYENVEMPEVEEDTTEVDLGLDEEFDPEAML